MKFNYFSLFIISIFYHIKVVYNFSIFNLTSSQDSQFPPLFPPSCGYLAPTCSVLQWFRRFDGSCSNPQFPEWGVPGAEYVYLIEPIFQDGFSLARTTSGGNPLPNARTIRNKLFPDGDMPDRQYTLACMAWGQFITHDMSHLMDPPVAPVCCDSNGHFQKNMHPDCLPLAIPENDRMMLDEGITCINHTRAQTDFSIGCSVSNTARTLNVVTSPIDGSHIYGLESNKLRAYKNGLLITQLINGVEFPPTVSSRQPNCEFDFLTGDSRANQNSALTALHIALVRKHNHLARKLHLINPQWNDQRLFMESRRIIIAFIQRITFYEWLPTRISEDILFGSDVLFESGDYINDYVPSVNTASSNEFAHACSRYFHTNIPNDFKRYNADREVVGSVNVADNIFCQTNLTLPNILAQTNIGLVTQPMSATDPLHAESITQFFNRAPGKKYGSDIRSTDILRGTDVGLAPYVAYRSLCEVGPSNTFEELSDFFSSSTIEKLKSIFNKPSEIDLSTGGSLEKHLPGSAVGPTFQCIMTDHFQRLRQGDIYFHEHPQAAFTPDQLATIQRTSTLARLFCDSGEGINKIQPKAFELIDKVRNPVVSCDTLPDIDLIHWKEYV